MKINVDSTIQSTLSEAGSWTGLAAGVWRKTWGGCLHIAASWSPTLAIASLPGYLFTSKVGTAWPLELRTITTCSSPATMAPPHTHCSSAYLSSSSSA